MKQIGKKHSITIDETRFHNLVKECVRRILSEETIRLPKVLYHKSPKAFRKSIQQNGLQPRIGDCYRAHYEGTSTELKPLIFMYGYNKKHGEYNSTYDDDIWAIDVSKLDKEHIQPDMDAFMKNCYVYDLPIPTTSITLAYKGTGKDTERYKVPSHMHIYEELSNGLQITDEPGDYGDDTYVRATINGENAGYAVLVQHRDIENLEDEISETDSYSMARNVVRNLDYNKRTIEIADIDVRKKFRNQGIAKKIIRYILNKYHGFQFYLRVCPTDGIDERTFANSIERLGFIDVGDSENGTFMVMP